VTVIQVEPTLALVRPQRKVADANAETIAYVETLCRRPAERPTCPTSPPVSFASTPASVVIYQLGNFGTASKRIWPR